MRLAPCVTLFLAVGLGACGNKPEPAAAKPAGPPATLITTTTAASIALDVTEHSLGSLEALIDPKIGAEVAGRVTAVHAKSGDRVRKGQLLAEIDPTDFHIQGQADAAEIARLEALVAQAERFAERQQQLVAKGFISQNGADDASPSATRPAPSSPTPAPGQRHPQQPGPQQGHRAHRGRHRNPDRLRRRLREGGRPAVPAGLQPHPRAHLPYPESAAPHPPGQPVRLTSPRRPAR
jgi:pyruvate/2-oxoglutarate dehydrogenase complex dihydrolipoamide acyltransferase (E2) component